MVLDEDDLHRRLAGLQSSVPVPPLAQVQSRSRQMRAARRRVRLGAGAVVVCGGVALAGPVHSLLPLTGPPKPAPGTSTPTPVAEDCFVERAVETDLAGVADLLYLPRRGAVGDPMAGPVRVRKIQRACAPAPVAALWYALEGNDVTRRVELHGPGVVRQQGLDFGGETRRPRARGTTLELQIPPREAGLQVTAYWREPDGTAWAAYTNGLTPEAVVTLLEGLTIEDGRLLTTAPPRGLDAGVPMSGGRQVQQTQRSFRANFRSEHQDTGGWTVEVTVGEGPRDGQGTRVRVGTVDAWWVGGPNGDATGLWWRGPRGEQIGVNGSVTLSEALRVARALQRVSPDDPLLPPARQG